MKIGCVVRSVSGHDKDRFYAVVGVEPGRVLIADGKLRKLEKPKRKNVIHIRKTNTTLDLNVVTTDKKLREALWALNEKPKGVSKEGGF